ncbi:hypothetical protein MTR_4g114990 [Medicago truncatula]|uniref:Uncharacterized protein n=1 Tax=Medicago truncatula TaxID=3880 RepID=G7JE67_MEDTR|nr:hypothetical protein MTR_4g114990 [Medicago truncatula]
MPTKIYDEIKVNGISIASGSATLTPKSLIEQSIFQYESNEHRTKTGNQTTPHKTTNNKSPHLDDEGSVWETPKKKKKMKRGDFKSIIDPKSPLNEEIVRENLDEKTRVDLLERERFYQEFLLKNQKGHSSEVQVT